MTPAGRPATTRTSPTSRMVGGPVVAELVIVCRRCGKEHGISESKGGRCTPCAVLMACEQHRQAYVRLCRKLERYRSHRLPHHSLDVQMQRVQQRVVRTIMELGVHDPERGEELLRSVLSDFEAPMRRIIRVV